VTWNAKKHGELVRLLKEFLQDHTETFWLGRSSDKELLSQALSKIEKMRPDDARIRHADTLILSNLFIWCDTVKRHYKMEPHQAIGWLVEQYYDYAKKERTMPAFRHLFGAGTVDSIARRMYQKAKKDGRKLPSSSFRKAWWDNHKEQRSECDAAVLEAGGDLYKLAFEELGIYPEPSAYLADDDDAYWEWFDDYYIPDIPDNR
jgi:hypothetical protein